MSTSYLNRLGAIDFSRTIERLAEGFTGREWLFDKLEHWLNQEHGEQFYLLTGEPGVGKSAIAAQLTKRWTHDKPEPGPLAAYHFCRAGDVETVRPGRVLRSLATQLGKTLPHYGEALKEVIDPIYLHVKSEITIGTLRNSQVTGIYVENLKELAPREEFRLLIQAPLAALAAIYAKPGNTPQTRKVFLIDSLDEAVTTTGQENMVTLLASLYQARETLPPWVRFLLTARADQSVLNRFLPRQAEKIEEMEDDNLSDIEEYIQGRVDDQLPWERSTPERQANTAFVINLKPLPQRLAEANLTAEKLVEEVRDLSHGNFLYTKLLLNSIASGEQSIKNLAALPKTLNDIYHRILRYRCSFRGWLKRYQPILGTLSVTQAPISQAQLVKFIGIDADELAKDLAVFQQFLDESKDEQGRPLYTIFHQSLREYLLDRKHNHDFWCDAKEQHDSVIKCFENESKKWQDLRAIDLYGLRYLAQHLVKANRLDNLHALLAVETSDQCNAWFEAKNWIGDIVGFVADVKLALESAERNWTETTLPQLIEKQCRYALIISSLNSISENVPIELLEALVRVGAPHGWTPVQGLAFVQQMSNLAKRAECLVMLAAYLSDDQREKIWQETLVAVQDIPDESEQSRILSVLVAQLPQKLYESFLVTAQDIPDELNRSRVLSVLVAQLPQKLYESFLVTAQDIQDGYYRAWVLSALAGYYPEAYELALESTLAIQHRHSRARLLSDLAAHYPEVYELALVAAQDIQSELNRAEVLRALATQCPEAYEHALKAAQNIQDERFRASVLYRLVVHLPEMLYEPALKAAQDIQDESHRASVLSALAAYLPETLYEPALVTAKGIQDESSRAHLLSALAAHLPQTLYEPALKAAQDIQDESHRASVLSALAAYLPETLYEPALVTAKNIQSEWIRTSVLSDLAAHYPAAYEPALKAALAIQNEFYRAEALSTLATHHPEVYELALAAAKDVQDKYYKAQVLSTLATHHPEVYELALAAAKDVWDKSNRAKILSSLAAHYPDAYKPALTAAQTIQDESYQAEFLSALSAYYPEAYKPTLAVATDIRCTSRTSVLRNLAAHYSDACKPALEAALAEDTEWSRPKALCDLAVHYPDAYELALETALAVQDEYSRSSLLRDLAVHYPDACEPALEAALAVQDEYSRSSLLSDLAAHLPQKLYEPALKAAQDIQDESSRARVLGDLATHHPEAYESSLTAILAIQNESDRAEALSMLAAHYPEVYELALEAIKDIQDEWSRAEALSTLAAHYPEAYAPALKTVLTMQNESDRIRFLGKLGIHYVEASELALEAALASDNILALIELIPQASNLSSLKQFTIWQKMLQSSVQSKRQDILYRLRFSVPLIAKFSGDTMGNSLVNAVQQVIKWWK